MKTAQNQFSLDPASSIKLIPITYQLILLAVAVLVTGCASMTPASKPVYPAPGQGDEYATLRLDNRLAFKLIADVPLLYLEVDGFWPTEKKCLPLGVTELRVKPGTHQIMHKGLERQSSMYYYNPVTSAMNTEKGKTYTIMFEYLPAMMRVGYTIKYDGWSNEETAQWPAKNILANALW